MQREGDVRETLKGASRHAGELLSSPPCRRGERGVLDRVPFLLNQGLNEKSG